MTKYSRTQEDRMERKLIEAGFELVEDVGRRTTGKGDKIMRHPDTGLVVVIDHKSTRGREGIRIERKQLEKIQKEAKGVGLPIISFSFLGHGKIYAIINVDDLEGVMY